MKLNQKDLTCLLSIQAVKQILETFKRFFNRKEFIFLTFRETSYLIFYSKVYNF